MGVVQQHAYYACTAIKADRAKPGEMA